VKVERGEEVITILYDDSLENSPAVVPPNRTPLVDSSFQDSFERIHTPIYRPPPYYGHQMSFSVVESLRRLQASKGARNVFKSLDYDSLNIQRVQFLPPTFNGDVLFELPMVAISDLQMLAKLMHKMDKRHAWTKTVIFHIKNDMSLTFRTSTCVGHLRCENQDCKYTSRIHCTSPVNELKWDGFTVITILVGQPTPIGSSLICKICKVPPVYIATCGARIYYVFGPANMTCACMHLRLHEHPVKIGED
jgi:hypothetical protein